MRKRILVVLACVMAFCWTGLASAATDTKAAGSKTTVSDANEKAGAQKKPKKDKKHEGKKKGQEKKAADSNSTGKQS